MNWRRVGVLVKKDYTLFMRNRFFAFVSGLGVVFYAGIYLLMPSSVDEVLVLAVNAPSLDRVIEQMEAPGLRLAQLPSPEAVRDAVAGGDYAAGVVFPPHLLSGTGQQATVKLHFPSDSQPESREAVVALIREMVYDLTGTPREVEVLQEVLGRDMLGDQLPLRDRMLPMLAVLIIIVEMLGLASLISDELQSGTARALLATPMPVRELFWAKAIMGVSMAFIQAALLMAVVGGLSHSAFLVLLALLLGALLVTGIGFLMASLSKDILSVMAWGVPAMVVLSVPAFGVMFPGGTTDWSLAVPSHYLVDTLHQVINFGLGWGEVWSNLAILLAFDMVLLGLGVMVLGRKLS